MSHCSIGRNARGARCLRHKLSRVSDHESQLMEDITAYVSKQGDLARIVNYLTGQIKHPGSCQPPNQAADERGGTHFKSPMKREEIPVRGTQPPSLPLSRSRPI